MQMALKADKTFECPAHRKLDSCPYESNLKCRAVPCELQSCMILAEDGQKWMGFRPIPPMK